MYCSIAALTCIAAFEMHPHSYGKDRNRWSVVAVSDKTPEKSQEVTGMGIVVVNVSVLSALSNFQAAGF